MSERFGCGRTEIEMNPWILIDTSGKITLMNHRAEMGQGIYQAVPQIIAEELEVDLDKVTSYLRKATRRSTAARSPAAAPPCAVLIKNFSP